MSKWISLHFLLGRWKIPSFEILYCFQKGLQPYSKNGVSISCPIAHHAHRHRSNELTIIRQTLKNMKSQSHHDQSVIEDILPVSESEEPTVDPSLDNKRIAELSDWEAKILEELKVIEDDDPGLSSWKHFIMPTFDQDVEKLLKEVKHSFYRLEDIEEFEREHDLEPVHEAIVEEPRSRRIRTKLTTDEKNKIQVQAVAEKLKEKYNIPNITAMARRDEIKEACDGKQYHKDTLHRWIRPLYPEAKRGRPKKTK